MIKPEHLARNNVILLVCVLILILFYPLFRTDRLLVRDLLLSAVFFAGIFSLEFSARSRMFLLPLAIMTVVTTWIHHFIASDLLYLIDFGTSSVTLAVIVVLMIRHIARSRIVTPTIILSSVNGYLLLGVLGAVLLSIADSVHIFLNGPGSAGILIPSQGSPEFSDYLYLDYPDYRGFWRRDGRFPPDPIRDHSHRPCRPVIHDHSHCHAGRKISQQPRRKVGVPMSATA